MVHDCTIYVYQSELPFLTLMIFNFLTSQNIVKISNVLIFYFIYTIHPYIYCIAEHRSVHHRISLEMSSVRCQICSFGLLLLPIFFLPSPFISQWTNAYSCFLKWLFRSNTQNDTHFKVSVSWSNKRG